MKNKIINPYTFFKNRTLTKSPQLVPVKTTNALIKAPQNQIMFNSLKNLLPNPNTLANLAKEGSKLTPYLPSGWGLASYLVNNYCQSSNSANFGLATNPVLSNNSLETNANQVKTKPISANPAGKETTATNSKAAEPTNYTLTGKYTTSPNRQPNLTVQAQVNKPKRKNRTTRPSQPQPKQRTKAITKQSSKPKQRFSNRLKSATSTVPTLTLNLNKVFIGVGVAWLLLLTILIGKLLGKAKKRK